MANSRYFQNLARELKQLRADFLPKTFDPLGIYSKPATVRAHARGYLVLAHAEVETFLETWAKELGRQSETLWATHGKLSTPLAHLLANAPSRLKTPEELINRGGDASALFASKVTDVFRDYYKTIKDNHGVKEENCLRLFGTIGVPTTTFGATLLPALESFGAHRGEHAHHAAKTISTPLDPETEYKRLTDLFNEIAMLDANLIAFKKNIR